MSMLLPEIAPHAPLTTSMELPPIVHPVNKLLPEFSVTNPPEETDKFSNPPLTTRLLAEAKTGTAKAAASMILFIIFSLQLACLVSQGGTKPIEPPLIQGLIFILLMWSWH
jgi:hypothetical protein